MRGGDMQFPVYFLRTPELAAWTNRDIPHEDSSSDFLPPYLQLDQS